MSEMVELDFLDKASVERHYKTLDLDEGIAFLDQVIIEVTAYLKSIYGELDRWNAFSMDATQRAGMQVIRFAWAMREKNVILLRRQLQREEETSEDLDEEEDLEDAAETEEPEEERGEPEFSSAQSCLAIHYLLHAARHTRRDETVERFIVALTGWKEDTIQRSLEHMHTRKKQTARDLKILKPYFEELGLREVVKLIETHLADAKNYEDEDF
jgi:hypothetical protein